MHITYLVKNPTFGEHSVDVSGRQMFGETQAGVGQARRC